MKMSGEDEAEPLPGANDFESGLELWDSGKIDDAISKFEEAGRKGFRADAI